jgi:type I restriction enzyme S subunit
LENHQTIGSEYYAPEFLLPYSKLLASTYPKVRLADCCPLITDGDHGSAEYAPRGVPFVLSEAVEEGFVRKDACRYITERHAKTLKRSKLKAGDVLVTKTGVYFGKSAVVDDEFVGANTIAHVGILRPVDSMNPYYLSTFLNSKFGQAQLRRRGIKATRPEIKLVEFDDILVPEVSKEFAGAIQVRIKLALEWLATVKKLHQQADLSLTQALSLDNWHPAEPLSYARHSTDVFAAGRLDADYFAPRVAALLAKLGAAGLTIGSVAPLRQERYYPTKEGEFDYIEISNVRSDGTVSSVRTLQADAPSRATSVVRNGDIVSSTVRPRRRLSALINPSQDGFVCSSGFVVLVPENVPAEVLLTYLRLPLMCELMDLHTSASLYPAISETDFLALPYHPISSAAESKIINAVQAAHIAEKNAHVLLASAKQAVEIAVEKNEAEAIRFLLQSRKS